MNSYAGGVAAPPTTPIPMGEHLVNFNQMPSNDQLANSTQEGPLATLTALESMKYSASLREDYITAQKCKEQMERLQCNTANTATPRFTMCTPLPCSVFERQIITRNEMKKELTEDVLLQPLVTQAEIIGFWNELASKLAEEHKTVGNMAYGLLVLQMYRRLCGVVPYATRLNQDLVNRAHKGASLIEKWGVVSRTLSKPDTWPDDLYAAALQGLNGSLAVRHEAHAACVGTAVHALMNNSGSSTWTSLPHRRWLLSPGLNETGFGTSGTTTTVYTYAASQNHHLMKPYTAFPPQGYFPLEWVDEDLAWSCSVNPMQYVQHGEVEVTISPIVSQNGTYQRLQALKLKEGVYVNTDYHGLGPCVVFKPEGILLADGSCYEVVITGMGRYNGEGGELVVDESVLADGATRITLKNTSQVKYDVKFSFAGIEACPPLVTALSSGVTVSEGHQYRSAVPPGATIPFVKGVWSSYTKLCASGPPDTTPSSTPERISYMTIFFKSGLPATTVDTADLG